MTAPLGGVIVLAAGRARRFGSDKRRHRLADGRPMLAHSVERYAGAFPRCIVVLRPDDPAPEELIPNSAHDPSVHFVRAPDADLGMGHSLAAGARAAHGWDYAFVALGDMPWVDPATLARLRAVMEDALVAGRARTIVQPVHAGVPGHPVGFAAAFLPELELLQGDEGARALLQRHRDEVQRVEVEDAGVLRDLDSPEAE
jgi:molybdenum cofactor cytidylyltransferase